MTKNCKKCNKEFSKKPSDSNNYWNVKIFCSKKCANDTSRNYLKLIGTKRPISVVEKMKATMFKKGHKNTVPLEKHLRGDKHPMWKGGVSSRYKRKTAPRPMPEQCEVCGAFGSDCKKGLNYDHNHMTGKFRGWLCSRCNRTLGFVKDNTEILKAMINYLNNSNA